jgi:hypothetical protein
MRLSASLLRKRNFISLIRKRPRTFNRNDGAEGYDVDVRNERDAIRAAYSKVLEWVVQKAHTISTSRVLELGSGTGNLSYGIVETKVT